jgi:small-conductance mechanosensitive channel
MEKLLLSDGHFQKIFSILMIVIVFAALIYFSNLTFRRIQKRRNSIFSKFLHSFLNIVLLFIAIYSILSQFEVTREISTVILQSSTLLIAVATFAAQQALSNVISGFMLSASRPLEIGQKVKILQGGSLIAEGIVKDMTFRHVVIESYDGQSNIVPNSVIDQAVIVNANYVAGTGNFLEFEVAYDSDFDKVRKVIRHALETEPYVTRKDITITTSNLTSNGVIFKFAVWTDTVNENFTACSNLRERIVQDFRKEGIEIPHQTIDLNLHQGFKSDKDACRK